MDKTTIEILQELVKYGQYLPSNSRQINACSKLQELGIVQIEYKENNGAYIVRFKARVS